MQIPALIAACLSAFLLTFVTAQERKKIATCKASGLAAVRPDPKLRYKCRPGVNDYDNAVLKWPERLQAIKSVQQTLQTFSNASWWKAEVDDLNACQFKKHAGKFTQDEQQRFENDYSNVFVGNHEMRLAIVSDPCYQVGYGGSVIFLLVRSGQSVTVSKIFDGYFSRVNNSVGFDWADLNGEQIVELETANSFPPIVDNFYFSIDKTHHALPRKLFKDGSKFTNEIYSDMLMSEPSELDLPEDAVELDVIKDHKLARTFSAYTEDSEGTIESAGKKFKRTIYRWSGKYYEPQ